MTLVIGDESGPSWGRLSDAILHLVFDEHVIAVVTSPSGATTHLSEQVGNRIGVPILTLSTDATATQINLPWIFRLGPSDTLQARIIAEDIYRDRGLRRVLLVTERDHDGRLGGKEFQEAAQPLGAPHPTCLRIDPLQPDADLLLAAVEKESPEAIVFWTQPENAGRLLKRIQEERTQSPIYLSQEAAQAGSGLKFFRPAASEREVDQGGGVWAVASGETRTPIEESFARRYELLTGLPPSPVAAEAYDAVRLIARDLRETGPNRARVRDRMASVRNVSGVSGPISFDNEGNNRTSVRLVRLR